MSDAVYSGSVEIDVREANRGLDELEKTLKTLSNTSGHVTNEVKDLQDAYKRVQAGIRNANVAMASGGKVAEAGKRSIKTLTKELEALNVAANKVAAGKLTPKPTNLAKDVKQQTKEIEKAFEKLTRLVGDNTNTPAATKLISEGLLTDGAKAASMSLDELKSSIAEVTRQAAQLKDFEGYLSGISNQRYALRDLATSLTYVAVATGGLVGAGVTMSASFERSFADVARTAGATGAEVEKLFDDLAGMTTSMPVNFGDITSVATLAGQLNIASQDIAKFTETVTKFAATTDVTVDAAAMGFGRLAQLTKTPTDEIDRLASAIYETGINSVATESAILQVASQIATTGNLAGFTVQEIIGLASALASLGVQPELARGAMMRIFGDITAGVGAAGDKLEQFASVSGMSANDFATTWANAPQEAFTAMLNGMAELAAEGENLDGVLREMGFSNVRDRRAWLLLADNTEVYADALSDATRAYEENISLSEGYAYIADTLSAKIQVLGQTFQTAIAKGFMPLADVVSGMVDSLQWFAEQLDHIASSPVGATIISLVAGLTGMFGLLAIGGAITARTFGGLLGMITAMEGLNASFAKTGTGVTRFRQALTLTRLQLQGYTRETAIAAVATDNLTGKMATNAARSLQAVRGVNMLAASLRALAVSSGITIAIGALAVGLAKLVSHMNAASKAADRIFGEYSGLQAAVDKDTAAAKEGGRVYSEFTYKVEESLDKTNKASEEAAGRAESLGTMFDIETQLPSAIQDTTDALDEQTGVLGENTREWFGRELLQDEEFTKDLQKLMDEQSAIITATGVDMSRILDEALSKPGEGAAAYLQSYIAQVQAAHAEAEAIYNADRGDTRYTQDDRSQAAIDMDTYDKQKQALIDLKNLFEPLDISVGEYTASTERAALAASKLNVSMGDLEGEAEETTTAFENLADAILDFTGMSEALAEGAFQDALRGITEAAYDSEGSFDVLEKGGYDAAQAIKNALDEAVTAAGDSSEELFYNLVDIYAHVEAAGAHVATEVDWLHDMLMHTFADTWGLDLDTSAAQQSIAHFIDAAIKAIQARAEIERDTINAMKLRHSTVTAPGMASFDPETSRQLGDAYNAQIRQSEQMLRNYDQQIKTLEGLKVNVQQARKATDEHTRAQRDNSRAGGRNARANRDNAKAAKAAAQEVRTLADWASDLSTVWTRAFDLRYGLQNSRDAIVTFTRDLKERFEDAAKAVRDARQSIREIRAQLQSLAADRLFKEYQLKVAIEYGDDLRAAELRAELAENTAETEKATADLADSTQALKSAQDDTSRSLTGNSNAAIKNRADVQSLIQAYQTQVLALANSGLSSEQLQKKTAELRDEFAKQLTQLGFNRTELQKYTKSFDDMIITINNVPRNVTVGANVNPALQALQEFLSKARNSSANVKVNASLPSSLGGTGGSWRPTRVDVGGPVTAREFNVSTVKGRGGGGGGMPFMTYSRGGTVPNYYASGGVAGLHPGGPRGTDTVPAWLTPGEAVTRRAAVQYYGQPFMNAINQMKFPKYLATGGMSAASGDTASAAVVSALTNGSIELGPQTRNFLARALQVQLVVDQKQLTSTVNAQNARNGRLGK